MRLQSTSMRRIRVPRRGSRSGCRVAPGPAGLSPSALVLTLPSIEAAGAQPPEHPGLQFTHTGASRGLTPFSADAVTEPDSLAPGFGPRGYGVATGVAQVDRTRDSQSLSRRAAITCWNTRLHTLPSLLSQPDRTRHMRCFHRLPVNRGCAHKYLGSAPYPNARRGLYGQELRRLFT